VFKLFHSIFVHIVNNYPRVWSAHVCDTGGYKQFMCTLSSTILCTDNHLGRALYLIPDHFWHIAVNFVGWLYIHDTSKCTLSVIFNFITCRITQISLITQQTLPVSLLEGVSLYTYGKGAQFLWVHKFMVCICAISLCLDGCTLIFVSDKFQCDGVLNAYTLQLCSVQTHSNDQKW